ncbi:Mobile element protein [Mucinivorans hirudinis]|uniref:Mobile element protein n=1 Tax=Mucinivorans hirudinis TaxID=1433126 RepID=A0A060R624_9BACT|nr:Mobile element protein [Mucinivorans hirudinis]
MEEILFTPYIGVGCGIDVHKDLIVATIQRGNEVVGTKEFDGFTVSLESLRDWCKDEGVTHIAMESTGVYWKPVFNILEDDFEVLLVNARHVKNVPVHKTDKKDSKWLSKLLVSGLLKGSFIPPRDIRDLRDLVRYKKKLVAHSASEKNRIIKILEDCNIKLSSVLSDVDGAVGRNIISALIDGESDVNQLMRFYHGKIKTPRSEFVKALQGKVSYHHRFMLQFHRDVIANDDAMLERLDAEIAKAVSDYEVELELLETIPGVGRDSAIGIISEIGVDMERFPDENHLSSYCGVSPGNNESAGKKKVQRP